MEVRGGGHDAAGEHAVGEALPRAVDVVQEGLEGTDSLRHPLLDVPPRRRVDHAGQEIQREGLLLAADVERDALVDVAAGEELGAGAQFLGRERGDTVVDARVGTADGLAVEHLVVGAGRGPVSVECRKHGLRLESGHVRRVSARQRSAALSS